MSPLFNKVRVRTTDDPEKPAPNLIINGAGVREAALASVRSHCGWCGFSCAGNDSHSLRTHVCRDAAGRDLSAAKAAAAEGARRELAAVRSDFFRPPPCELCHHSYPP